MIIDMINGCLHLLGRSCSRCFRVNLVITVIFPRGRNIQSPS
jgi:hypothetical protein